MKNVQYNISNNKSWKILTKADTPMTTMHQPELDANPELHTAESSYYMSLIGILGYIFDCGRYLFQGLNGVISYGISLKRKS